MSRGRVAMLLAALGCAPVTAPAQQAEPPPGKEAPAPTLAEIRADVVRARKAETPPTPAQCDGWVQNLDALWRTHGDPYVVALLDAGHVLRWCGRAEEARATLDVVARKGPRWARARAYVAIADLDRAQGRSRAALDNLRSAVRLDPALTEARLELARALTFAFESGMNEAFSEAERIFRAAMAKPADASVARVGLARLYAFKAKDADHYAGKAELLVAEALQSATRANEPNADAHVVRGILFLRARNEVDALRAFKRACELESAEGCAQAGIGLVRMRNWAEGLESLALAQRDARFADDRAVLRARGSAFVQLKQFGRAERVFDRLLELDPGDPANHFDRANLAEVSASAAKELQERELLLSDAALHYRAYLRGGGYASEEGDHARAFLLAYGTPGGS